MGRCICIVGSRWRRLVQSVHGLLVDQTEVCETIAHLEDCVYPGTANLKNSLDSHVYRICSLRIDRDIKRKLTVRECALKERTRADLALLNYSW